MTSKRNGILAIVLIPCLLGLLAAASPMLASIDFGPFQIRDTIIGGVPTFDFYYKPTSGTAKARFFGNNSAIMDVAFLDAKVGIKTPTPLWDLHVVGSTVSEGSSLGIYGTASSSTGRGVAGLAFSTGDNTHIGVVGGAYGTSGGAIGVNGQTSSPSGYGVLASGNLGATGTKSFLMPHPTDPSRMLAFSCLEGNENGTYFRGSGKISSGVALVEVPEEFRMATEEKGLTMHLTAVGAPATLWVKSKSLEWIEVGGDVDVEFDYTVHGVRRGYANHETMRQNTAFVPEYEGMPFGSQYPDGIRGLLVQNGTLNPDGTPNVETARRMGWTLRPSSEHPTLRYDESSVLLSNDETEF